MSCAHAIRDEYEIYLSCAHAISHEFQKCRFLKKLKNYLFFIGIRIADFSWGMNNKRIIEFNFRKISELFRPRSALSASASLRQITLADLGLNNSEYPAQPYPVILNCYTVLVYSLLPDAKTDLIDYL